MNTLSYGVHVQMTPSYQKENNNLQQAGELLRDHVQPGRGAVLRITYTVPTAALPRVKGSYAQLGGQVEVLRLYP